MKTYLSTQRCAATSGDLGLGDVGDAQMLWLPPPGSSASSSRIDGFMCGSVRCSLVLRMRVVRPFSIHHPRAHGEVGGPLTGQVWQPRGIACIVGAAVLASPKGPATSLRRESCKHCSAPAENKTEPRFAVGLSPASCNRSAGSSCTTLRCAW